MASGTVAAPVLGDAWAPTGAASSSPLSAPHRSKGPSAFLPNDRARRRTGGSGAADPSRGRGEAVDEKVRESPHHRREVAGMEKDRADRSVDRRVAALLALTIPRKRDMRY